MTDPKNKGRVVSRRGFMKWTGSIVAAAAVASAAAGIIAQREDIASQGPQTVTSTDVPTTLLTVTSNSTSTEQVTTTLEALSTVVVSTSKTLTTTLTKTATDTVTATAVSVEPVTVTSASSQASTGVANSPFTVFWITDTQFLSETNPALFGEMTDWIANQWGPNNGKLIIHTGDIVQTGAHQDEWQNADLAMSTFLRNGMPYTWCAGNHDDLVGSDSSSGWIGNQYAAAFDPIFVSSQVNMLQDVSWVGDYNNGMDTALEFTANGLKFLVVNLEWNGLPGVLQWAKQILDDPQYADHHVILAPHAYINASGFALESSDNKDLTDFVTGVTALADDHPNVFLTLNGHYATECGYNTPSAVGSRNELMFDRQDCTDDPNNPTGRGVDTTSNVPDAQRVGGSTVTLLSFDTANNRISVSTYDVNTTSWRDDSYERYSFTMFPAQSSTSSAD